METTLKRDTVVSMELVWSGSGGRETSGEFVVPDTMPDVGEILDTEGIVTVRGKETGAGYVQLGAGLVASVLYVPAEGGAPRSLEFPLPADVRFDAPKADTDCRTVAQLRLRSMEARAVNSRKISVRAELEGEARCYRLITTELTTDIESGDVGVHTLTGSSEVLIMSDVGEKSFVVTDEYGLPPECGSPDAIIAKRITPIIEDVKFVSGKAVFRGRILSELVFSLGEGGISAARYETEFSQIMEIGDESGEGLPEVTLLMTAAYYDLPEYGGEASRISAELHYVAQCECRQRRELRYIRDAYSNRTELVPQWEEMTLTKELSRLSQRQTVSGLAEPAVVGGELIRASGSAAGIALDHGVLKATVNIRMVFRMQDGRYTVSRCRMQAEFTLQNEEGSSLDRTEIAVTDIYCSAGAEVRASIQLNAMVQSIQQIRCVSSVTADEEAWAERERTPSMVLIRVPEGTELWDIARRYHSTLEAIDAVNGGRRDGLLLIPKGR